MKCTQSNHFASVCKGGGFRQVSDTNSLATVTLVLNNRGNMHTPGKAGDKVRVCQLALYATTMTVHGDGAADMVHSGNYIFVGHVG